MKKGEIKALVAGYVDRYPTELVSQLLDTLKRVGFHTATRAGVSIGKNDIVVPEQKEEILGRYDGMVNEIEEQWDSGFISDDERLERVIGMWTQAKNEVEDAMKANLYKLNPIYMMANSGARGNYSQITQLAGMRGLMTNTKGEIMEEPVKSNFMEGLSVLEYFTSTHGARKGQADTALRTADSGYLTRRLVDVSQDVVIHDEDCGTDGYVEIPLYLDGGRGDANDSIAARFLSRDLVHPETGEVIAEAGTDVTPGLFASWREQLPRETLVPVRTPSKCESPQGVCQACYGRALSTYRPVDVGEAVGIIAAQSIGEPGTQLTMRTFHTGGIAGEDITAGLPRVVELFEARHPKAEATLADIDGYVSLEDIESDRPDKGRHHLSRRYREPGVQGRAPALEAGVRRGGRGPGEHPDHRRLRLPAPDPGERPALRPRHHPDRALPGRRGAEGLPGAGRGHPRQAHRGDRTPDAPQGRR